MLELGSSGSVRGVSSNGHLYRDPGSRAAVPSAGAHSRCTLYCGRTVILPKASRRCHFETLDWQAFKWSPQFFKRLGTEDRSAPVPGRQSSAPRSSFFG